MTVEKLRKFSKVTGLNRKRLAENKFNALTKLMERQAQKERNAFNNLKFFDMRLTHDLYADAKEAEIRENTSAFNRNIKWFRLFSKLEKA